MVHSLHSTLAVSENPIILVSTEVRRVNQIPRAMSAEVAAGGAGGILGTSRAQSPARRFAVG